MSTLTDRPSDGDYQTAGVGGALWLAPRGPADEAARLAALRSLDVLHAPPGDALDRVTRLAARVFDVPMAMVSLADANLQCFVARVGLDVAQIDRRLSFCSHAMAAEQLLVVEDTARDPRFANHPLVLGEPYVRFYAGQLIRTRAGQVLGTLCILDSRPRRFSDADRQTLVDLAALAQDWFHAREARAQANRIGEALVDSQAMLGSIFAEAAVGMALVGFDGRWLKLNQRLCDLLGYSAEQLMDMTFQDITHPDDLALDLDQIGRMLAGKIPSYTMEKRYYRADGLVIWVQLTVSLMRDVAGVPLHFLSVINNITERKQAQQELSALHGELEARVADRTRQLSIEIARSEQLLDHLAKAKQQAEAISQRFTAAAESQLDGYFVMEAVRDAGGAIVDFRLDYMNRVAEGLIGHPREALLGRRITECVPALRSADFFDRYVAVTETGQPWVEEVRVRMPGIQAQWIYHQIVRFGDGITISSRDITKRKQAELGLRLRENLMRQFTDALPAVVSFVDAQQRFGYCNRAFYESFHTSAEAVSGRTLADYMGPENYDYVLPYIQQALAGQNAQFDFFVPIDGHERVYQTYYIAQRDLEDAVSGFYLIGWDITGLRQREARLKEQADVDALTGLLNRKAFMERLDAELACRQLSGAGVAVLFLDIDHFKRVNDTYGHAAGDALIGHFGKRVRASVRSSDVLARLGGDEFVLLLCDIGSQAQAEQVACAVLRGLTEPVVLDEGSYRLSASIGVAWASDARCRSDALLARADEALYAAKAAGRSCWRSAAL